MTLLVAHGATTSARHCFTSTSKLIRCPLPNLHIPSCFDRQVERRLVTHDSEISLGIPEYIRFSVEDPAISSKMDSPRIHREVEFEFLPVLRRMFCSFAQAFLVTLHCGKLRGELTCCCGGGSSTRGTATG